MKDWAVELCMTNAPSYEKFMQGVGPGFSHILNVAKGPSDARGGQSGLSDEEKAVARNLGLSETEYAASRGD